MHLSAFCRSRGGVGWCAGTVALCLLGGHTGTSQKDSWQARIISGAFCARGMGLGRSFILKYEGHSSALDVSGPIYVIVPLLEERQSY